MRFNIGDRFVFDGSPYNSYMITKCKKETYDIIWNDGQVMTNIHGQALLGELNTCKFIPSSLTLLKAIKNASNSQQE